MGEPVPPNAGSGFPPRAPNNAPPQNHAATTRRFQTAGGCVGDGAEAAAHNNAALANQPPAARSVAAPGQQPARSPDTVLHLSQTTGGLAETVGDGFA
ncbi:MAG: hypothetical protein LBD24_04140 [Spirochaetaceae bacterium]|nr:hypothetical protein [Spirochaetaceae bacterium]